MRRGRGGVKPKHEVRVGYDAIAAEANGMHEAKPVADLKMRMRQRCGGLHQV